MQIVMLHDPYDKGRTQKAKHNVIFSKNTHRKIKSTVRLSVCAFKRMRACVCVVRFDEFACFLFKLAIFVYPNLEIKLLFRFF